MSENKRILVVGTGTIGEPLIGLLCRLKDEFKIDEVMFHKRTPLLEDSTKVESLIKAGAKLVTDSDRVEDFQKMGFEISYVWEDALDRSRVVVDCTPAGLDNKKKFYENYSNKLFIAQGSEKGFGDSYALGITDKKDPPSPDGYLQVVSCNTHAIARLLTAITDNDVRDILDGDFTCIRRANDVSQDNGFTPSTSVGKHGDPVFGTHHARDVNDLFGYSGDLPIFSSALKTNTQYMHAVRFSIVLPEYVSKSQVLKRLEKDEFVCTSHKTSANQIFSFGRDHGFYGRIYSQTVVSLPTVEVFHPASYTTKVVGVAFTPQDGNSLMSSVATCLYGIHGNSLDKNSAYFEKLKDMMAKNV
jgi:glyceraldehyde-3-phosphate dehydrogenase (NAD(P))